MKTLSSLVFLLYSFTLHVLYSLNLLVGYHKSQKVFRIFHTQKRIFSFKVTLVGEKEKGLGKGLPRFFQVYNNIILMMKKKRMIKNS